MHFLKRVGAFLRPVRWQFILGAGGKEFIARLVLPVRRRLSFRTRSRGGGGHRRKVLLWPVLGLGCFASCFVWIWSARTAIRPLPPMMAQALATNGLTGYPVLQVTNIVIDASAAIQLYESTNQTGSVSMARIAKTAVVAAAEAPKTGQNQTKAIHQENSHAVADYGKHHVQFAANLNTHWAVNLLMVNGQEMNGDITGVYYFDSASGQGVKLGTLKDSQGEILSTNQIIYRDAFDGIKGDVCYTYTETSLEQDVVIRKQLVSPAKFNLNPATTRLMVMTEFLNPPEPAVKPNPVDLTEYNRAADVQGETSLDDELIIFKTMRMGRGKAFSLGEAGGEIPVGKQWIKLNGKRFLTESTPYPLIKLKLDALPPDSAKVIPRSKKAFKSLMAESPVRSPAKSLSKTFKMAEARMREPGVVLDYLISSTPLLNINFGGVSTNKVGFAAAGQATNDFWNGYHFASGSLGALTNLVWSDESSSSAGVTVSNAPGAWGNPVSDGMYKSYIYRFDGSFTITLTNVASGIYDFFLYGHGALNNQSSIFQLTSGSTNFGTNSTTMVGSNSWTSTAWQEGVQYIVFRNISVSSNQPVTITVAEDGAGYSIINGLQLAPDNPATTIYSLINVDFGYDPTNEVGRAAVGLTTNDVWNYFSYPGDTDPYGMGDLDYSDGTESGAGITVNNAPGEWENPVSDPMYASYIYQWDANPIVLAVTNLSYGRYDFYLYGHGAADNQNSVFDLSVGGVDYGTRSTTATGSNSWNSVVWQEGLQYVVFRDVWVENDQTVNITVNRDGAGYAIVNGLQIVQPMESTPDAPFIVTQPQSHTNVIGQTAVMSVSAAGGPLYYQWYLDVSAISGATQSSLVLTDVQSAQGGAYYVTITNTAGSVTSSNAALTVVQPQCFAAPTNLVSWWQAESNFLDSVGGNNGTLEGSATYVPGMVGTAFGFDGDSSGEGEAVLVGSASNLQLQNFTVDAWIQRGDPTQASLDFGGGLVFSFGSQGYGFGLNDNGQLFLSQIDDSEVVSSLVVTDTSWHHVAVTMNNSNVVFYVDGVADSSQEYDVEFTFSTPAAAVGARGDSYFNVFLGALDEVDVFSRALTADEVAGIYGASILGKCYGSSPTITTQPLSHTNCAGDMVTLSVTATGTAPLLYEWLKNGAVIAGATGSAYNISSLTTNDAGTYSAVLDNRGGETTSSNAILTVNSRPTAAVSGSALIWNGNSTTILASLMGSGPWQVIWSDGTTNTAVGSSPVARTVSPTNTTTYAVTALSDSHCTADSGDLSGSAIVRVQAAPTPQSQTVTNGQNATFTVVSNGTPALTYQWQFAGTNITGATGTALTLSDVTPSQAGTYTLVVSNGAGLFISTNVVLREILMFTNFADTSSLALHGNAIATNTGLDGHVLELTPAISDQAGSAFLSSRISLGINASFSTFFSFRLSQGGGSPPQTNDNGMVGADGIVFVVQTGTNWLGGTGGTLGFSSDTNPLTNCVGIEFDTWYNRDPGIDPDGNHVGVDVNGSVNYTNTGLWAHVSDPMNNGNVWYAWIDYNGATSNLQVYVSETNIHPSSPTLSATINMMNYLGSSNAYAGFTAGTGGNFNQQDILSWEFSPQYGPIGLSAVSISITNPTQGEPFLVSGPAIAIDAIASSSNAIVTNVQFFVDGTSVGSGVTNSGAPGHYTNYWTSLTVGYHTVTAWAFDNGGASNSASVNFAVDCVQSSLSSLTFSNSTTSNGAPASGTITLSANAGTYGQVVTLSSDNTNAIPPISVFVPGGQSNANFMIQTLPVTNTATAHIWASYQSQSVTNTLNLETFVDPTQPNLQPAFNNFTLTTVVTNFPTYIGGGNPFGPEGMVINNLGQLMVSLPDEGPDGNFHALYILPSDKDGQGITFITNTITGAAEVTSGATRIDLGGSSIYGMARVGSHIYAAYNTNLFSAGGGAGIAELSDDGSILRRHIFIPAPTGFYVAIGLAENPQTGHLYLSAATDGSSIPGIIYDVDPATWQASILVNEPGSGPSFDGVSVALDGRTVYVAAAGDSVLGFDTSTAANVFNVTIPPTYSFGPQLTADGTAVGQGVIAGKLFANCNDGTVWEVDLATGAMNVVMTNGTRGDFAQVDINDGTLLITQSDRILRLIPPPGGSFGPLSGIICTRNDTTTNYSSIILSNALVMTNSTQTATFDLRGIPGAIQAATFSRADTVSYVSGSDFDLELGFQSTTNNGLTNISFGLPTHLPPTPSSGVTGVAAGNTWSLSQSNIVGVQQQMGAYYQVNLVDRISSVCSTFTLTNSPQSVWPQNRNTLIFFAKAANSPQIPQGECLDISMPGPGKAFNGNWQIVLNNTVIATPGNPNGWDVEDDHNTPGTPLNGDIITAPASAAVALGYEVDAGGASGRVGYFDVVRAGSVDRAATLMPMVLSTNESVTSGSLSVAIELDRPAPPGGAAVVMSSDNTNIIVPSYVIIPENGTGSAVTVNIDSGATDGGYNLTASYNGFRQAAFRVRNSSGSTPSAPTGLAASAGAGVVTNTWNPVSGALSYNIKRSLKSGGPYITIFSGLDTTNYIDTQVVNGTTYYYVVSAFNDYGESGNSSQVSATPIAGTVATPVITALSTNATNVVIQLADSTPGATMYYTLDGSVPTQGSSVYSTPISLIESATIQAKAYEAGYFPSAIATTNFTVAARLAGTIVCGEVTNDYLGPIVTTSSTNVDFSWFNGQGYFARHYQISVPETNAGGTFTITMFSSQADSLLYLTGGSYSILASNDNDYPGTLNSRITYAIPTNSTATNYYIEATTARPGQAGFFALLLDCGSDSAAIGTSGYGFDGTYFPSASTDQLSPTDLGTVPISTPATATLYVNNYGGAGGLDIKSLKMTGDFIIRPQAMPPVAAYMQTNLSILLSSFTAGTKNGTLTISNNSATNPLVLYFTATVTNPPSPVVTGVTPYSDYHGNIQINVSAYEANGLISKLELYAAQTNGSGTNTFKIGQIVTNVTSVSTSMYWYQPPAGIYNFVLIATDFQGRTAVGSSEGGSPWPYTNSLPSLDGSPTISPNSGTYTNQVQVAIGWTTSTPAAEILFTTDTNTPPQWFIYTTNLSTGTPPPLILTTDNGVLQTSGAHSNSYLVNLQVRAIEPGYLPGSIVTGTYYITNGPTSPPSGYHPVAEIDAPEDGTVITGPTNIVGIAMLNTMDTVDTFSSWVLEYRLTGSSGQWTPFGTGTNAVGSSGPASFGSGVNFDPTVLLDGLYDVRLTVSDNNGDNDVFIVHVLVQGKQKVGIFTLSFVDLTVPVAGVPIQVTRTYDSRDKGQGDFGVGWRLSLSDVRIQESAQIGTNWAQVAVPIGLGDYSVQPLVSHLVTVTFPGDQVYSFEASLDPSDEELAPIFGGNVIYNPLPGTQATLTATEDSAVIMSSTDPGQIYFQDAGGMYDPDEFQLTLHDGRVFLLSLSQGLESITDQNGNEISFNSSGISQRNVKLSSTPTNIVSYARESGGLHRITNVFLTLQGSSNAIQYTYGSSGGADALNLLQVRDRVGNSTMFSYDSQHYLTNIVNPAGIPAVRTTYDGNGRITQIIDAQNNVTSHAYGPNSETIKDPLGNTTANYCDPNGNVTNNVFTSADGTLSVTTSAQFADPNNPNKPTMTVDALGRTNVMVYSPSGDLLSTTDPMTNTTTYAYNGFGQVTSITDARDIVTIQNEYDNNGNLISSTDANGSTAINAYNPNGTLASTTDALENVTSYVYGDSGADPGGTGQPTRVYDANNHETSNMYDVAGDKTNNVTARTLADGSTETITSYMLYDENSRVTNTVINGQSQGQTIYNSIGKVGQSSDANGGNTSYLYDETGRLIQTITSDGFTNSTVYDQLGRQVGTTDKANNSTKYLYDGLGRQSAMVLPDGASTTNQYDPAGQLIAATDANGNTTQYFYDNAGRQTQVIDASGNSMTYEYDEIGNRVSATDARGNQTQFEYDDAGRLVTTTFPDETTQTTTYNAFGQKVSQTDQAGAITQFDYDVLGRLVSVTNALTNVTRYAYDEVGNQTNQVDALNHKTTFEYDALGRRTKRTLPGGQSESFGYDAVGNLLAHTNFNGLIITNNYDSVNRLSGRWNGTTNLENYTYNALGELMARTDTSGNYTWAFDSRGRLTNNVTPVGTLNYNYDANGNQTSLSSTTSGGVKLIYQYDALNRLTNVLDVNLGMSTTNTSYTYDAVGNLQTLKYPNGVTNLWKYDSLNHLTNLVSKHSSTLLGSFYYQLGPTGTRTNLSETINASIGRTYSWKYDALYRLTNETISNTAPTGSISYGYDAVGNRTNRSSGVTGIGNQTPTFNTNDWISTDGFDSNGNTTTNSSNQIYRYDYADRLTNFNGGAVVIVYDAEGNRIQKVVGSTKILYLVSGVNPTGYPQVVEEFNVSGTTNLSGVYTYGLSLISQRVPGISTNFFGFDGHGSTRFLTDSGANIANVFAYDAYGTLIASNSTPQTAYLYCCEQFDTDLAFYYLRARYMAPNTGRFWTMDTDEGDQADPLSLHKYLYAEDDPVDHLDPSGLEVAVYTHIVFYGFPWRHANIRLYPDNTNDIPTSLINNSATAENPGWQFDNGRPYFTIGAGNDDDFFALTTHINRNGDLATGKHRNRLRFVVPAPGGISNDQFIVNILDAEQFYVNTADVFYWTFPIMMQNSYNSNSYVVGLLYAVTGVNYGSKLPINAAGRGRPVPSDYFTPFGGLSATIDNQF